MELRLTGLNQLRISGMHYIYLNTHTRTYIHQKQLEGDTVSAIPGHQELVNPVYTEHVTTGAGCFVRDYCCVST